MIWPVGGGKGGAGKSVATANIGCALAMSGRKVVLVDADPGGEGLHACFGIDRPAEGMDVFAGIAGGGMDGFGGAAVETGVEGLRLISGAGQYLRTANPSYTQKQKIIARLKDIDADCVLVDLGSGSSYNALDFFAMSKTGVIVLVPEPASVQNAYDFLKNFVYSLLKRLFAGSARIGSIIEDATDAHRPGNVSSVSALYERLASVDEATAQKAAREISSYRPRLLLNMAAPDGDMEAVDAFCTAAKSFLGIEAGPVGYLRSNPSVEASGRMMRPFMLDPEAKAAHGDIAMVVEAMLTAPPSHTAPATDGAGPKSGAKRAFGFNDNVPHRGEIYHVQTEAHGGADPAVETMVYKGGRVFFSKRAVCRDDDNTTVRDFARRQHSAAMAAIKMDKIDLRD